MHGTTSHSHSMKWLPNSYYYAQMCDNDIPLKLIIIFLLKVEANQGYIPQIENIYNDVYDT